MEVARIPIDDPGWREFVLTHPDAGPFHLPTWAGLIADCYHFQAFSLVVRDADGQVLAGMPAVAVRLPLRGLRWVSLPFTDNCSVLTSPGVTLEAVVAAINTFVASSDVRELEVRSGLPALDGLHPRDVGYHHFLALPRDPAELHPQRNYRQHRNQATKRGVTVARGVAPEDVDTFYTLQTLTRRRLGVPVQPRRWFELVRDRMLAQGHGFIATAMLEGEPVAAVLYLTHNGTMVAKYSASDPDRPDTGASHLIHWEVMSAACIEGYRLYDLGRADPAAEGLRVFKTRMGAEEAPLVYTHIAQMPPRDSTSRTGEGLSRRIIRVSPRWVCRALGEALYRWTA